MGQSSFDATGATGPLSLPYQAPYVCRYVGGQFTWLPNVRCTAIRQTYGPHPHTAHFRYIQDDNLYLALGWPSRVDMIWPLGSSGPYVVQPDDRLVVMSQNPDGSTLYLFDGFAQIPQADLTANSETATFTAVSVAAREFDSPISGRTQRDADPTGIQDTSGDSDVPIDLPCRFNPSNTDSGEGPGFLPNKTPDNFDTVAQMDDLGNTTAPAHPVFVDPGIQGRAANQSPAYWSIADAIKYILAEYNGKGTWTQYPALSTLDDLLAAVYSAQDGPITPGDITSDPLLIRDYDASNKPYPEAIAELLGYAGFFMRWDLESGIDGGPTTYLRIFRADMLATTPTKWLYLDDPGNSLAAGSANNIARAHLARDSNAIVNAWQVETAQRVVETSIILAPLYQPATGDASAGSSGRNQFFRSTWTPQTAITIRRKYRWYGVDECGDGHWLRNTKQWVTDAPFDFTPVFPVDEEGNYTYTNRYRPGSQTLLAVDANGNPLRATLEISFDYQPTGALPEISNGTGTWYAIKGGWRLLEDRLGIEVTVEDPENWNPGKNTMPGGDIKGVTWFANPGAVTNPDMGGVQPVLRLTTVIQDDLRMPISVGMRDASPTQFARWRVADARDHFQYATINEWSINWAAQGSALGVNAVYNDDSALVMRDDTDAATAHAYALQRAHEMPPLAGSITIPGCVDYYDVGDQVSYISGRGIRLYRSTDLSQGELPTYPIVVSREFQLDPKVYTTLHIGDLRAAARNAW